MIGIIKYNKYGPHDLKSYYMFLYRRTDLTVTGELWINI